FSAEIHEDEEHKVSFYDQQILIGVASLRRDALNGAAVDLTALGSLSVLTVFTIFGLLLLIFRKNLRGAAFLFSGAVGSGLLSSFMKNYFSRARPTEVSQLVEVSSYSYPSGHSLAASSFYLLVSFLLFTLFKQPRQRIWIFIVFISLIIIIGFSRVYLGVHYRSDVVGGMLLGSAWTFFLAALTYGNHNNH